MLPTPDAMKWASLLQETLQQLSKLEERMKRLEDCHQSMMFQLDQLRETCDRIAIAIGCERGTGIRKTSSGRGKSSVTKLSSPSPDVV